MESISRKGNVKKKTNSGQWVKEATITLKYRWNVADANNVVTH